MMSIITIVLLLLLLLLYIGMDKAWLMTTKLVQPLTKHDTARCDGRYIKIAILFGVHHGLNGKKEIYTWRFPKWGYL
jgi:hypothetical protein